MTWFLKWLIFSQVLNILEYYQPYLKLLQNQLSENTAIDLTCVAKFKDLFQEGESQNNTWSLMQMLGYLPHSDSKQSDSKEGAWSNILKMISIWLILCTAYSNTDMAFQYICTTKGSFNISKLVKYLQKVEFPKLGEPIHKELKQINWNSKVQ